MNFTRLFAIVRKETLQISRDSRSLMIVLLMPLMLMTVLGYGVNLDIKHLRVLVYDREGSQASQDLLKRFQYSQYFDVVGSVNDYASLERAIDGGQCQLGIVIPHDFSQTLADGRPSEVQAIVDGTDQNTAQIAIGYAQAVVAGYAQAKQEEYFEQNQVPPIPPAITVQQRTWFNEDLESKNFIVPGVAALVMAVIGTLLTSLTIAREWERGTMEQLISTPVTALEIIVGKLVPYFAIGLFDTAVCAIIAVTWFGVPFRGSIAVLFVGAGIYLIVIQGLGFWISVVTRNQLAASQIGLLAGFMPSMLLSGFTFPIEQMPAGVRPVTFLVAARYFIVILKSVFLKGTGLAALAAPALALTIYALIVITISTRSFKKSLA
ncbi:MAG TPA: ABC transporter permease [Candidatus Binataceae bacterium]|nr:ABC transporter permease [Candidatus Binataceae bacterium]